MSADHRIDWLSLGRDGVDADVSVKMTHRRQSAICFARNESRDPRPRRRNAGPRPRIFLSLYQPFGRRERYHGEIFARGGRRASSSRSAARHPPRRRSKIRSPRCSAAAPSHASRYSDTRISAAITAPTTRSVVEDPTRQRPGTITVDTRNRYLYLSMADGHAIRYGVGVGRQGFTWRGQPISAARSRGRHWTPPSAMLRRRPDLPRHMTGGVENPLGARAMYLYSATARHDVPHPRLQ